MTQKPYNEFDSREEFVKNLNHWHFDKWARPTSEFQKICSVDPLMFSTELVELKKDLDQVRQTWNNQSQLRIRQEVSRTENANLNLDILAGQENDRLRAGYNPEKSMYHVCRVETNSIWDQIAQTFGLDHAMTRLHVQFPGDVTAWHTDIFAPYHNLLPTTVTPDATSVGQDVGLRRIIMALDDWDWGQCFMFGAQTWSQWRAGDVVYWEFGVPHCAANMGFSPRICMSITGTPTPVFDKLIGKS